MIVMLLGVCSVSNTCRETQYLDYLAVVTICFWVATSTYTIFLLHSLGVSSPFPQNDLQKDDENLVASQSVEKRIDVKHAFSGAGLRHAIVCLAEGIVIGLLTLSRIWLPCLVDLSDESYKDAMELSALLYPLIMGGGAVFNMLKADPLNPQRTIMSVAWRFNWSGTRRLDRDIPGVSLHGGTDGLLDHTKSSPGAKANHDFLDHVLREESLQSITQGIVATIEGNAATPEEFTGTSAESGDSSVMPPARPKRRGSITEMRPAKPKRRARGREGGEAWVGQLTRCVKCEFN